MAIFSVIIAQVNFTLFLYNFIFAMLMHELCQCICRKYETAQVCISPALYRCPLLKKYLKEKLDSFDYACSHMDPRPGNILERFKPEIITVYC